MSAATHHSLRAHPGRLSVIEGAAELWYSAERFSSPGALIRCSGG